MEQLMEEDNLELNKKLNKKLKKRRNYEPIKQVELPLPVEIINFKFDSTYEFKCDIIDIKNIYELPGFPNLDDNDERGNLIFEYLIAPLTKEEFYNNYFEKKCLLIKRNNVAPNYYKKLFSMNDLSNILKSEYTESDIDLVSYENNTRIQHNLKNIKKSNDNLPNLPSKCSLRVIQPANVSINMWKTMSSLEEYFLQPMDCICEFRNEKSSVRDVCFDNVETFIAQSQGSVSWKLYSLPDQILTESFSAVVEGEENPVGEEFFTCTVEAGDLLYFPRGVQTSFTPSFSLSAAITVLPSTYGEFETELVKCGVVELMSERLNLRRSIPFNIGKLLGTCQQKSAFNKNKKYKMSKVLEELKFNFVDTILRNVSELKFPFDTSMDQRFRIFLSSRLPPCLSTLEIESQDLESNKLTTKSSIRLIRSGYIRIMMEEDLCVVYTALDNKRDKSKPSSEIVYGSDFGPSIEYIINSYPEYFKVGNLPQLSEEDQISLIESLLENKIVRFE